MRNLLLAVSLSCLSLPAMASCDSLKAALDAKLQAKGVASYTLEVVSVSKPAPTAASGAAATPAQESREGKVVGTCEGDTKQIIYTRN